MFENAAATGTLSGMRAPAAESIAVYVIEITIFAERWRADLLLGRLALAIGARLGAVDAGFSVSDVEPGGEADEWDLVGQWRQLNADANPPADKTLHTVTAWFTGELKGAGDDVVETAVEDVSLAIILDALDGLAQAGVGEAELDYDGANPDQVPFGDSRYAIELPRATLAKGGGRRPGRRCGRRQAEGSRGRRARARTGDDQHPDAFPGGLRRGAGAVAGERGPGEVTDGGDPGYHVGHGTGTG